MADLIPCREKSSGNLHYAEEMPDYYPDNESGFTVGNGNFMPESEFYKYYESL